ncbi:MAG: N-methyl-L-tryptophan oxidase [Trueperaceae bacterium]|nr:N-methyl-L-tryptophan oxidase [Trueperaceae bacterium]
MTTFDTIVIGAGVIGAAAARRLALDGSVLVLEQHELLHERGSSHGGSRIFRHAYVDELHTRLAVRADPLWGELEAETGERLLFRTGGVDLFAQEDEDAEAMLDSLAAAGSPGERLSRADLAARFPIFDVPDGTHAVYHPASAVLPATRAVAALLRSAAARGAELREREPVLEVLPGPSGVAVRTSRKTYAAGRLVIAAGAWLGRLTADLRLPLVVEQQQVVYLPIEWNADRQNADRQNAGAYLVGRMPVFIERRANRIDGIYGLPAFEYPHAVKVAHHDRTTPLKNADERDFALDQARAADTVAAATRLLPGLGDTPIAGTTCLYTRTPDEAFIVDRHPLHANVVLLGGGSGHAFKFGPLFGDLAADLLDGAPAIREFRADRFG